MSSHASPATYRFAPKPHYCVLLIYLEDSTQALFALDLIDNSD